jgi:hypothetical protein
MHESIKRPRRKFYFFGFLFNVPWITTKLNTHLVEVGLNQLNFILLEQNEIKSTKYLSRMRWRFVSEKESR